MHQLYVNQRGIIGQWDAMYARYLDEILKYGETFVGRNGETKALFGASVTVDLRYGFPLTRLRKMPIKNLFREFLFDIGFDQNVAALGPARHFWDFLADADGNLVAANIIADMSSIACTDLEGEWADKLVGHLNSDDFFNVSEHKTSSFTLRNIEALAEAKGDATHTVTGDFTIRGITKSVTFAATVNDNGGKLSIAGTVELDRSQFDVKYGSGSFFDNLGDNLIHDNFTVGFNLVADAQ